jgi:phosphoribosylformimino-5-aminoimidazole carboxamide ribonucleotide (ProFAR) isomerase
MEKKFTLTGTLTKVDWFNPHIVVYLDARKNDGSVENWKFESNPPSWFRRVALAREDFAKAIGQTVTVEGVPAKSGVLYGYLLKITFPDGNSLELVFKGPTN